MGHYLASLNMQAALLTQLNAPLEVCPVDVGGLDYGQVEVDMLCSGICGAQLQEIRGEKGGPLPHLLGHEGCGTVVQTGVGVTRVKPGDRVVLHWRKADGIESPFPEYLVEAGRGKFSVGTHMRRFTSGKVTTLAQWVLASENRVTPVPAATPPEFCALLGCGLSTALGTIEREAQLLFGETILILGVGGLGSNLILAARMRGAARITAVDPADKEGPALELGADEFHRSLPAGKWDVVIDTSGHPDAISQGLQRVADSGRFILVGQPPPGVAVPLTEARHFFGGEGKQLRATQGGQFRPHLDIPRYVALHAAGKLDLTGIITHRFPLADVNAAIELVRTGQAGRVMVHCR